MILFFLSFNRKDGYVCLWAEVRGECLHLLVKHNLQRKMSWL